FLGYPHNQCIIVRHSSFVRSSSDFFFFCATATTALYTLSLHDALPISLAAAGVTRRRKCPRSLVAAGGKRAESLITAVRACDFQDRKSTRLNSSHVKISYAVFCLKKKIKPMIYP